jgi:hypothetical protein
MKTMAIYSARKMELKRPNNPEMTPKPSHLYLFDLKIETSDAIKKDIAKTL